MPITETQRRRRRNSIGSSDSPALVLSDYPWKGPYDVWADKCLDLDDIPANKAMERGSYLEDGLLQFASDKVGIPLWRNQTRKSMSRIFHANVDALSKDRPDVAFEAKTSRSNDGWGAEGTSEVPDYVNVQCQHHMLVCNDVQVVYVPVVFGLSFVFSLYEVHRSQEFIDLIWGVGEEFWRKYVVPRVAPPVDQKPPSLSTLNRMVRIPDKTIQVSDPSALVDWQATVSALSEAKKANKLAKERVIALMGEDAEIGECADFGEDHGKVTYFLQERKEHTVKASSSRTIRFKKPKKKKEEVTNV